jgi:hypothetical protein
MEADSITSMKAVLLIATVMRTSNPNMDGHFHTRLKVANTNIEVNIKIMVL